MGCDVKLWLFTWSYQGHPHLSIQDCGLAPGLAGQARSLLSQEPLASSPHEAPEFDSAVSLSGGWSTTESCPGVQFCKPVQLTSCFPPSAKASL